MKPICSIFFHNYYGEHEYWIDFFSKNITIPSILYYNIVSDSIYNLNEDAAQIFKTLQPNPKNNITQIILRLSNNKGKDIGGKLILFDAYQKIGIETEYGLFLHDKKSIYKANNITWANDLLKIAAPDFQIKVFALFAKNADIGIITASGNIINEYDAGLKTFRSTNKLLLNQLLHSYNISPRNYEYVAGTMFWFRIMPLNIFFTKNNCLQVRELFENGNVTDQYAGTFTHSWERILSWIFTLDGHKINII